MYQSFLVRAVAIVYCQVMLDARIKLRHLRTFVEVASRRSVQQAADVLAVTQPAVSKTLKELEEIANSFPGVCKSYAVQAGREIRIIVESKEISDDDSVVLSRDVAKKIEANLSYPGQIKVTVIRETRAVDFAK